MGEYLCSYPSAGHCGQNPPVEKPKFPRSYTSVRLVVVPGDKAVLCIYLLAAVCWTVMLTEVVPPSQRKMMAMNTNLSFWERVPWPFWCPWWKFVAACSQSCGIIFDRSQVGATSQVVTWDRSWTLFMGLGLLRWKLFQECELYCCSVASVWVSIVDSSEKSFRRGQYFLQKDSIGLLIPRFIHYTFKNYCYFKLLWTWKLLTAYFLCHPGWKPGTLWLDSSKCT